MFVNMCAEAHSYASTNRQSFFLFEQKFKRNDFTSQIF